MPQEQTESVSHAVSDDRILHADRQHDRRDGRGIPTDQIQQPVHESEDGQKRGNSGVFLQNRYEVQVLDSYGLAGENNDCGGIYKLAAPRVNVCAPPLQWQTFDIEFRAARFDSDWNKTEDARITVYHNGVLIHENLPIPDKTTGSQVTATSEPDSLSLQDHGNPVWFRNIWLVELPPEDK